MANIKSAKKRIKVIEKKTERNKAQKSELKTYIKKYDAKPTADLLSHCTSLLDRAVSDNIIHQNKANRMKARLAKKLPAPKTKKAA